MSPLSVLSLLKCCAVMQIGPSTSLPQSCHHWKKLYVFIINCPFYLSAGSSLQCLTFLRGNSLSHLGLQGGEHLKYRKRSRWHDTVAFFHPHTLHCSNFMKSGQKVAVCKRWVVEEGLNQGLSIPTRFTCKQGGNTWVCSVASGILHQDTETLLEIFPGRFVLSRAHCFFQGGGSLLQD